MRPSNAPSHSARREDAIHFNQLGAESHKTKYIARNGEVIIRIRIQKILNVFVTSKTSNGIVKRIRTITFKETINKSVSQFFALSGRKSDERNQSIAVHIYTIGHAILFASGVIASKEISVVFVLLFFTHWVSQSSIWYLSNTRLSYLCWSRLFSRRETGKEETAVVATSDKSTNAFKRNQLAFNKIQATDNLTIFFQSSDTAPALKSVSNKYRRNNHHNAKLAKFLIICHILHRYVLSHRNSQKTYWFVSSFPARVAGTIHNHHKSLSIKSNLSNNHFINSDSAKVMSGKKRQTDQNKRIGITDRRFICTLNIDEYIKCLFFI